MDPHFDWIAVGSGASGLASALWAAHRGLKAIVIEKAPVVGGATAYSYGGLWAPNNMLQRAAGFFSAHQQRRIELISPSISSTPELERHGRIHTALSWMESRRNVNFACGAFGYGVDSDLTRLAISSSRGSRYLYFEFPSYRGLRL